MKYSRIIAVFLCLLATSLTAFAEKRWTGTWATAPQLVEPGNMPPAPGLAGNTLRQIVRVSIGGNTIRLRLSNAYSDAPLVLKSVTISPVSDEGTVEERISGEFHFN